MKYLAVIPLLAVMVGCGGPSASDNAASELLKQNSLKENYSTPAPAALEEPKFEKPKDGEDVAVITTKFGNIVFKFRPDKAPKHVENFKNLASKGFYDKTLFHRVIPTFMIQGGDPNTKDPNKKETYGQGGPGTTVAAEFNNLDHKKGVISMARSQDPDSAGSQFFVVVVDSAFLNNQYTAFGEVVSGIEVAEKIAAQPRNSNDLPNERIEMSVKIAKWPVK